MHCYLDIGGYHMIVKWLDFSDLHFQFKNADTVRIRENLLEFIKKPELSPDFILMCGDFFYAGQTGKEEIDQCENFIHKIISNSCCNKSELYMTPGNHDINRNEHRQHEMEFYTGIDYKVGKKIHDVRELDDSGVERLVGHDFNGFKELHKQLTGKEYTGKHKCIEKDGYRILNINTCILAGSPYDEENLSIYSQQLIEECNNIKNDDKINIAFMHYGIEYLRKDEQKKIQLLLEDKNIDIVFSGHSHRIGISTYDYTETRICQFTCGGPLKDDYNKPSFYYCIYDSDTHKLECKLYSYTEVARGGWDLAKSERRFKEGICSFILPRVQAATSDINKIKENYNNMLPKVSEQYLEQFGIKAALPLKDFIVLRNNLIQDAEGDIILAGQSLENAFDIREDNDSIVNSLKQNKKIRNIDIFLTDPIMFDSTSDIITGDTPISRIDSTMHTILYEIYKVLTEKQSINIYFIPLVQLDHMVFVNDILLLRHTLLWTNDSHYKATPLVCERVSRNSTVDKAIVNSAMYNVYEEYIEKLKSDSMIIEIQKNGNQAKHETLAKRCHRAWRGRLYQLRVSGKLKGKIVMHKLYRTQLISDLHATWDPRFRTFSSEINWADEGENSYFNSDSEGKINCTNSLYLPENLLNDATQKILLPYVKETERLLNNLIKRYDKEGEAHIFPSLDIGCPNNILRLAGGFATGMLVVWKCGTPLVPVDTTVNVCSSSYYEFDASALYGKKISEFFNVDIIQRIINKGSVNEGLAFSFNTGNHFLLLCKSRMNGKYYLVLHSSAKQFKDTFLGLYPKPHNWYSDFLKVYQEEENGRYINYLKDAEAERFINIARSLNEQNKDIHNWFAKEIFGNIKPTMNKTFHHYGMPTDYSIAIGTYIVDENDVVPIFSKEGYPIFLFRASSDMWSIELAGKKKYIIPHGWGQEMRYEYFKDKMTYEEFEKGVFISEKKNLMFTDSDKGAVIKTYSTNYDSRFDKEMVAVRDLFYKKKFNGSNIYGDTPYLKGTIENILDPVALYSNDTCGKVKYYYEEGEGDATFIFS